MQLAMRMQPIIGVPTCRSFRLITFRKLKTLMIAMFMIFAILQTLLGDWPGPASMGG